jgi:hypothetical protein
MFISQKRMLENYLDYAKPLRNKNTERIERWKTINYNIGLGLFTGAMVALADLACDDALPNEVTNTIAATGMSCMLDYLNFGHIKNVHNHIAANVAERITYYGTRLLMAALPR